MIDSFNKFITKLHIRILKNYNFEQRFFKYI